MIPARPTNARRAWNFTATLAATALAALAIISFPATADQTEVQLKRTKAKAAELKTRLSQTLYRTETYQAEYTVQVPYEDTEVYYEQVPYQEEETYQDWEEYTEMEHRCHDETRYEQRCGPEQKCETTHHRECAPKEVCENIPHQKCETHEECRDVPRPVCHPREVCRDVPEMKCEPHQECSQVPRQQCHTKQVCHPGGGHGGGHHGGGHGGGPSGEVCHPQQECTTVYETQCHTRQKCEMEHRRQCHTEQECRTEHDRQCHPRQRCHTEYERKCHTEQQCHDRPETKCHTEQVCRQVPVPHRECRMEPVTKRRMVTKTRIVTKYRQEQRTRVVVKYRDETRCCVTKQREVYDHEYAAQVKLLFPETAVLEDGERELFSVELTGVDQNAGIKVKAVEALYSYNPEISQLNPNEFQVKMNMVPTYRGEELGIETIKDFAVKIVGDHLQVTFKDAGSLVKVQTAYGLQLRDATTDAVLAQDQRPVTGGKKGGQKLSWNLPTMIAAGTKVRALLTVARSGIVIEQPVNFVWDKPIEVQVEPSYNPKPYMDKSKLTSLKTSGKKVSLAISFIDGTKIIEQVTTAYQVKVSVVEKTATRLLGEKIIARESLTAKADRSYSLSLLQDLGIAEAELTTLGKGAVLKVDIEVRRTGSRLNPNPVKFSKTAKLKLK